MPASDIDSYITIFKIQNVMKVTLKEKIHILKLAIINLRTKKSIGMCTAIIDSMYIYWKTSNIPHISNIEEIYSDFTHNNYIKFYKFLKVPKYYNKNTFWDKYDNYYACKRRIIFLRYLILKLRIQQFKQWYTTLH